MKVFSFIITQFNIFVVTSREKLDISFMPKDDNDN